MGKKSHKTTSTVEPPSWAVGNLTQAGNDIMNTVNSNAPQLSALEGKLTGMLPGLQGMAMDTSHLAPGFSYANDVLGGKYLNSNPYLNSIVNQGEQDAANSVNSTFGKFGRTGSSDHAGDLARGVAQAGNQLRYTDYSNERQRMAEAAGMLPALNASQFAGFSPLLAGYELAGRLPYAGVSALSGLGNLYGGYGTTSGKQPGGWLDSLLAAGAQAGTMAAMSDRRLKTNITKIGEAKDGLGIYEWNWKTDPAGEKVRGVIADEVKELRPHAYVPNFRDGYDGVNYAALGSLA